MPHQKITQDLIAQIDRHIDQLLNIDVVTKKSGYSKWYLQQILRTVTHQTLSNYIHQRRLLLIVVESLTIERPTFDIAVGLGYVFQRTFSRVFRRQFDRTPGDYRRCLQFYYPRVNSRAGNYPIHYINTYDGITFAKDHPW